MKQLATKLAAALALLCTAPARAGVSVPPKVIFHGSEQEVTVNLANPAIHPSLVKVWVDDGNEEVQPEALTAPFLPTPSLFRLEPGASRQVRILHLPDDMPLAADRETRFYLNVLDVPPNPDDNDESTLLLAVHYRLRLVYRPTALAQEAAIEELAQQVQWSLHVQDQGWTLRARNPTPHYLFFRGVTLAGANAAGQATTVAVDELPPFTERSFTLEPGAATPGTQLSYVVVDDHSQEITGQAKVAP